MKQQYDSSKTSLNQVSAVYKQFPGLFPPGTRVLDYGGGRYDKARDYMVPKGVDVQVYDPFNRSKVHNDRVMKEMRKRPDVIVCSNVLNVIAEDDVIRDVVGRIRRLCKSSTVVVFLIHEGKGNGIGAPTSRGYQRNAKAQDYARFMTPFGKSLRKGRFYICTV